MARTTQTVSPSTNARPHNAQPPTARSPPNAPRLRPVQLPLLPGRSPHTYQQVAYAPLQHSQSTPAQDTRWQEQAAAHGGGALQFYPGPRAGSAPHTAPPMYPPPFPPPIDRRPPRPAMTPSVYPQVEPATYAAHAPIISMTAASHTQAIATSTKRRDSTSSPLTPSPSPPFHAAAPIQSRRRRTSADGAQSGTFPTT